MFLFVLVHLLEITYFTQLNICKPLFYELECIFSTALTGFFESMLYNLRYNLYPTTLFISVQYESSSRLLLFNLALVV